MLSDNSVGFIRAREKDSEEGVKWSRAINESFNILRYLLSQELPNLTQDEWLIILDAHNGVITDFHFPIRLASDIMDHYGVISVDDLADEIKAVVLKVYKMSQAQQCAILDMVKKYWSYDWSSVKFKNLNEQIEKIKKL